MPSSLPWFRFQNTMETQVVSSFLLNNKEFLVGCGSFPLFQVLFNSLLPELVIEQELEAN